MPQKKTDREAAQRLDKGIRSKRLTAGQVRDDGKANADVFGK
jgi:hypothetical protein